MLRSFLSFLSCVLVACGVASAAEHAWHDDYSVANQASTEQSKPVLLFFTGTDWCPPCQTMWHEVLNTEKFRQHAGEKFILTSIDFPRNTKLDRKIAEQNTKLAEHYHVDGYPTIVLTAPDGRPFWIEKGAVQIDSEAYFIELHGYLEKYQQFLKHIREAYQAPEPQMASKLAEALSLLPESLVHRYYRKELQTLTRLDPQDKTGYQAKLANAAKRASIEIKLSEFFENGEFGSIIRTVDEVLTTHAGLFPATDLQRLFLRRSMACVHLKAFDEAFKDIDRMVEAAPDSDLAQRADQLREMIQARRNAFKGEPAELPEASD